MFDKLVGPTDSQQGGADAFFDEQFANHATVAAREHVVFDGNDLVGSLGKIFSGRFVDGFGEPRIDQGAVEILAQFFGSLLRHGEHWP